MIRGVYLRHTHSGHNKHYFVWIEKALLTNPNKVHSNMTVYVVMTAWGGIGKAPQKKAGLTFPSEYLAQKELAAIIDQRVARGYDIRWDSATTPVQWVVWMRTAPTPARETDYANIQAPAGFGLPGSTVVPAAALSPTLPTTVVGQGAVKTTPAQMPGEKRQTRKNKKAVKKVKEKVTFKRHDADWNF